MHHHTNQTGSICRLKRIPAMLHIQTILCLLPFLFPVSVPAKWPAMVPSSDGTPISYDMIGQGEPALVFVHGWSCDLRYWREQVPYFKTRHRLILLDLAGHGHSGTGRSVYTMGSFGEDVAAVVRASESRQVILIGHSMGGAVIAEAARLVPDQTMGLIGVDTLENIEYPMTREGIDGMTAPLKSDFREGVRKFLSDMIYPGTDAFLTEWIMSDMAAAPPAVAISAMENLMDQYVTGETARVFEDIRAPVVCVNGDLWPIDYAANRRHMAAFDAIVLDNADHFVMLNQPERFNQALEKAIRLIREKR